MSSIVWRHYPENNTFTSRERRFTAEMIKKAPAQYELTDRITGNTTRNSERECKRWAEKMVKVEIDWTLGK